MWYFRSLRKMQTSRLFVTLSPKILFFALTVFFFEQSCWTEIKDPPVGPNKETQASGQMPTLKVLNEEVILTLEGKAEILVSAENGNVQGVRVSVRNIHDATGTPPPEEALKAIKLTPSSVDVNRGEVKTITVEIEKDKQVHFKEGDYTGVLLLEAADTNLVKKITLNVPKDQTVVPPGTPEVVPPGTYEVVPSGTYEQKKRERSGTPTFVIVIGELWEEKSTDETLKLVLTKGKVPKIGQLFAEPLIRSDGVLPKKMKIIETKIDNSSSSTPLLDRGKEANLKFKVLHASAKEIGEFTSAIHISAPELTEGEILVPIRVIVRHHWGWLILAMVPGMIVTLFLTLKYIVPAPVAPSIELPEEYLSVVEKMQNKVEFVGTEEKLQALPKDIQSPDALKWYGVRYDTDKKVLTLENSMKRVEGKLLLLMLSRESSYKEAVENLFKKSLRDKKERIRFNSLVDLIKHRIECVRTQTSNKLLLRGSMSKKDVDNLLGLSPVYLTPLGFSRETSVKLEKLPQGLEFPDPIKDKKTWYKKFSYDDSAKRLIFRGIISEKEKEELLSLSPDDLYQKAIGTLFQRSRKPEEVEQFKYAIKELFKSQRARWGRFSFTIVTLLSASTLTVMTGLYTLYYAEKSFGAPANYLQAVAYGFGASLGPGFASILPVLKTYIDSLLKKTS